MAVARAQAAENLDDAMDGLSYEIRGTYLEGLGMDAVRENFRRLLENSTYYMLARRCGLDLLFGFYQDILLNRYFPLPFPFIGYIISISSIFLSKPDAGEAVIPNKRITSVRPKNCSTPYS